MRQIVAGCAIWESRRWQDGGNPRRFSVQQGFGQHGGRKDTHAINLTAVELPEVCAVAGDQHIAAMVDGSREHRTILLGQRCRFRAEDLHGGQATDADMPGDGIEHGKAAWGFRGKIAARLFEDMGVRLELMAGALGKGQQATHRAFGARGREENVGVEK